MTRQATPPPPSGLSADGKKLWRLVHAGWVVDDAGRAVLAVALRASARAASARAIVKREGLVIQTGKTSRPHPALQILKDAELIMLKAWRQLGLQGAPAGVPGRPPGAV